MLVKDKVAIVTGGGRGLGKAIALTLAQEGADVAVFDISQTTVAETAKEITKMGRKALAVQTDVSRSADVEKSVQKVLDAWGRIDILVNNAALVPKTLNANLETWNPFLEMTDDEWARQIGVNLSGVFYGMRAASRPMIAQGSGRIITIGSIVGINGGFFVTPSYSAAKAGLIGMTKLAARWLGKYGISVNVVNPGPVETEGAVYGQDQLDVFARVTPLKRKDVGTVLGLPQDMANAVLFLASDLSSYITGACINVSGGQVMG